MMIKLVFFLTSILVTSSAFAGGGPDEIIGIWKNASGKGHVEIYKENGKYYGKLVWLRKMNDENGIPYLDKNNPDKDHCKKPLLGLIMLRDFSYDDGEWNGGKIYNPEDGKEYKSYMKLKDTQTLFVRGFIGFSMFGKTLTFERVK